MAAGLRDSPSVLVVDDDAPSLAALAEILSFEGYSVLTAHNGTEALEKLHSHSPSLMIVDMVMPNMGGGELLARKRGDPALAPIPVIVISGLDRAVEADARLSKPFDLEQLFRTIRDLLPQDRIALRA
jgi:CheY-like chemotaxis protein